MTKDGLDIDGADVDATLRPIWRNRRRGQTAEKLDTLLKAGTTPPQGQAM